MAISTRSRGPAPAIDQMASPATNGNKAKKTAAKKTAAQEPAVKKHQAKSNSRAPRRAPAQQAEQQPAARRTQRSARGNGWAVASASTPPKPFIPLESPEKCTNAMKYNAVATAPGTVAADVVASPIVTLPPANCDATSNAQHLIVSPAPALATCPESDLDPRVSPDPLAKINWSLYDENDRERIHIAVGLHNIATAVLFGVTPIDDVLWWMDRDAVDLWGIMVPMDLELTVLQSMIPGARDMSVEYFAGNPGSCRELLCNPGDLKDLIELDFSTLTSLQPVMGKGRNDWEASILKFAPECMKYAHHVATAVDGVTIQMLLHALACKLYVLSIEVLLRAVEGKHVSTGMTSYWLHDEFRQGMRRLAGLESGVGQMPQA